MGSLATRVRIHCFFASYHNCFPNLSHLQQLRPTSTKSWSGGRNRVTRQLQWWSWALHNFCDDGGGAGPCAVGLFVQHVCVCELALRAISQLTPHGSKVAGYACDGSDWHWFSRWVRSDWSSSWSEVYTFHPPLLSLDPTARCTNIVFLSPH